MAHGGVNGLWKKEDARSGRTDLARRAAKRRGIERGRADRTPDAIVGRYPRRRRRKRTGGALRNGEYEGAKLWAGDNRAAGNRESGRFGHRYGTRLVPSGQRLDRSRVDVLIVMMRVDRRMRGDMAMHHHAVVMTRVTGFGCVQMEERRRRHAHLQAEAHEQDEAEPFHLSTIVSDIPERVKELAPLPASGR